ncbi:hypothetical protein HY469_03435, partial [Candidatus Roizmanbacteria bacterium]|nr:hypothetical protein [Candidatus Roizmanbacteria bacterium]
MTERTSWLEKGAEFSKKIDNIGIIAGIGMMAFGLLYSPLLVPGAVIAGTSVATKWGAEKVRKWAEKKRRQKK